MDFGPGVTLSFWLAKHLFFYRVASTGCFERAGLLVLVLPARLPLPGAPDWRSLGGPAGHTTFKIFPERNFIEA